VPSPQTGLAIARASRDQTGPGIPDTELFSAEPVTLSRTTPFRQPLWFNPRSAFQKSQPRSGDIMSPGGVSPREPDPRFGKSKPRRGDINPENFTAENAESAQDLK
jgi:hypothetical protein